MGEVGSIGALSYTVNRFQTNHNSLEKAKRKVAAQKKETGKLVHLVVRIAKKTQLLKIYCVRFNKKLSISNIRKILRENNIHR